MPRLALASLDAGANRVILMDGNNPYRALGLVRLVLFTVLLAGSGCGGQSSSTDTRERGGASGQMSGGSSSLPGSGGSESGGASGSTTGGGPSECVPPMFREVCLSTCFAEKGETFDRICVDGMWGCPEGSVFYDDCPPESCAGVLSHCCDGAGRTEYRDCTADGTKELCPSGSRPIEWNDACAPAGIVVESCLELDGTPCSSSELFCNQSITSCYCPDIQSPRWECLVTD